MKTDLEFGHVLKNFVGILADHRGVKHINFVMECLLNMIYLLSVFLGCPWSKSRPTLREVLLVF